MVSQKRKGIKMKSINVGLGIILAIAALSSDIQARTYVHNETNYEIKVAFDVIGSPNWLCIPKNSIKKDEKGHFVLDASVPGLAAGKKDHRNPDLSNIKKNWKVWAKIDGVWSEAPVVQKSDVATGGTLYAVNAHVIIKGIDPVTNQPKFDIIVKSGW